MGRGGADTGQEAFDPRVPAIVDFIIAYRQHFPGAGSKEIQEAGSKADWDIAKMCLPTDRLLAEGEQEIRHPADAQAGSYLVRALFFTEEAAELVEKICLDALAGNDFNLWEIERNAPDRLADEIGSEWGGDLHGLVLTIEEGMRPAIRSVGREGDILVFAIELTDQFLAANRNEFDDFFTSLNRGAAQYARLVPA